MVTRKKEEFEERKGDKKIKLSQKETLFILRVRTFTQQLRLFIPLFVKQAQQEIVEQRKVVFYLADLIDEQNNILKKNRAESPLTKKEVQTAINSVLTASKAPIIDWQTNPFVEITESDAKRIATYITSLTPLQSEREALGIEDIDLQNAYKNLL